jgi:hypothetical protein
MKKFSLSMGLIFLLSLTSISHKSHENISNFNITPILIDTINEKILVVHKRYATLYFKQTDIQEYIKKLNHFGLSDNEFFPVVNAMLQSNKKRIDLKDWSKEYTDEEKNQNPRLRINQDFDQSVMIWILYVGFGLIHNGKFMIVNNQTGKITDAGLKMISQNGEYGIKDIQLQLPSGFSFWRTITIFGDY